MNQRLQHIAAILLLFENFLDHIEILNEFTVGILLKLLGYDQLLLQLVGPMFVDDVSVLHVFKVVLD